LSAELCLCRLFDSFKSLFKLFQQVGNQTCYFLDPNQNQIMNDRNPEQIIVGPASSGKTLLIQLKVIQILETEADSKVLILVPLEKMKQVFQTFIDQHFAGKDCRYICS